MGRKVLAAVDLNSVTDSSVSYGIQLAARIEGAVIVIVVSTPTHGKRYEHAIAPGADVDDNLKCWLDKLVDQSQQNGVAIEIFHASGDFFEEISRFASFNPSIQFIVMAAPEKFNVWDNSTFVEDLKLLRKKFDGEILLVQKAGHVTRVPDLSFENPSREI
ncbi:MAG: universal stress protein [Desulfomonilaceae bacterium]